MSYQEALEAAGAIVHAFEEFGSYQGDWYAKVEYEGRKGWVAGSYGSCLQCDAFESEFGEIDEEHVDYNRRLTEFGIKYLEAIMTDEEAKKKATTDIEWDTTADEILAFITKNSD